MLNRILLISIVIFNVACASLSSTEHRPDSYYSNTSEPEEKDLFVSGDLTDSDIAQILDYRLVLPKQSRIALLKLSGRWYGNELNRSSTVLNENLIKPLKRSSRIYDVSFMPSMLVPDKRSIPYLREAAARYQADLLLLYRTHCQKYQDYNVFKADRVKATCDVEVALLDVRKGIVPFTSLATESVVMSENTEEINFYETQSKAQEAAIGSALIEVGQQLQKFVEKIPVKQS